MKKIIITVIAVLFMISAFTVASTAKAPKAKATVVVPTPVPTPVPTATPTFMGKIKNSLKKLMGKKEVTAPVTAEPVSATAAPEAVK